MHPLHCSNTLLAKHLCLMQHNSTCCISTVLLELALRCISLHELPNAQRAQIIKSAHGMQAEGGSNAACPCVRCHAQCAYESQFLLSFCSHVMVCMPSMHVYSSRINVHQHLL